MNFQKPAIAVVGPTARTEVAVSPRVAVTAQVAQPAWTAAAQALALQRPMHEANAFSH